MSYHVCRLDLRCAGVSNASGGGRGLLTVELVFLLTWHFVLSRHYRLEMGILTDVDSVSVLLQVVASEDGCTDRDIVTICVRHATRSQELFRLFDPP